MHRLFEFTAKDLLQQTNRDDRDFAPKQIRYIGFSFRSKTLWFNVGKYRQKVRIPDMKVISKMKGDDTEKVELAIDSDIQVHCSCPDFKFGGFQYMGTMLGYTQNKEIRPPDRNNPKLEGAICKHLTYLLERLPNFKDAIVRDIEHARRTDYRTTRREDIEMDAKKLIEKVRTGEQPIELIENILQEFDKYSPEELLSMAEHGEADVVINYLVGEGYLKPNSEMADKIRDFSAAPDAKLGQEIRITLEMWSSQQG